MIADILADTSGRMDRAVDAAKEDFSTVRTGRANPALFQKVMVDYYGSPTPLAQLASLNTPEARTLVVTPYDKSALKAIEQAKARERQIKHLNHGEKPPDLSVVGVCPQRETGRARDVISKKVGFSSDRQMRRAEHVANIRPDRLAKIDSGETTIYGAYNQTVKEDTTQGNSDTAPDRPPVSTDQVARAGVIRLMKNPHFVELREELRNSQGEATAAKTKLKRATEAYDNKVKHFENNIDFLSRRVRELEKENAELRARLGMEARHEKRVEFGNPDGIIRIPEDTLS